jgi:hypothetical protein
MFTSPVCCGGIFAEALWLVVWKPTELKRLPDQAQKYHRDRPQPVLRANNFKKT